MGRRASGRRRAVEGQVQVQVQVQAEAHIKIYLPVFEKAGPYGRSTPHSVSQNPALCSLYSSFAFPFAFYLSGIRHGILPGR